jgi:Domain of unknown function (DUF4203)
MQTDSFFAVMCGGMFALLFGLMLCFGGYRLFLVVLPIWAFFFGFGLGAQAVMTISPNDAFLATLSSWVVGFIVAAVCAMMAYLYYLLAVGVLSFSLGYLGSAALLMALGLPLAGGAIAWMSTVLVGMGLAFVVLRFNIQKWAIEFATAFLGAGVIVGMFVLLFGGSTAQALQNPVRYVLSNSPFWVIVFLILGVAGFVLQGVHNRNWEMRTYKRLASATTPPA